MRTRLIIILVVSFLFTGCLPLFLYNDTENTAREHMRQAIVHENNSQFNEASKEYTIVTKKYSTTSYYKRALYRSALAKIDPENPKPDYTAALTLIQTYLSLSLSNREKRIAKSYEALLGQIKKQQNSIVQQKKDSKMLKKELNQYKTKTKELKERLQKMKVIDVQMHKNKRK